MKTQSLLLSIICGFSAPHLLPAQVPQLISYQGRVAASGTNFTGAGQFKFALVDGAGAVSHWSNDGTSANGAEPTAAVALPVVNGLFFVLLGDATLPNMGAIPVMVFTNADVRLRIWFRDGTNSFVQLSPDQRVAAVGYAMMAASVADGAITDRHLSASGALSPTRLKVGVNQTLNGNLSTISGGSNNAATADGGAIVGGQNNRVTDNFGVVAGGANNQAGNGDGTLNNAPYATVGGGRDNTAAEDYAVISGGWMNSATGFAAVVSGGRDNVANGSYATVPGGQRNRAQGNNSFAAGTRAQALHRGVFVWADSADADFPSTTNDSFLIRAANGVGINTTNPAASFDVNGSARFAQQVSIEGRLNVSGVTLAENGSLNPAGLTNGSITSTHLAAGSVNSSHLAAGSVNASILAVGSVNASHLGAGSVTASHLTEGSVSYPKLAGRPVGTSAGLGGVAISPSSGVFQWAGDQSLESDVTNLLVTISTTGRPVFVGLIPDGNTTTGGTVETGHVCQWTAIRDGTAIGIWPLGWPAVNAVLPCSSLNTLDFPAGGTHTYKVRVRNLGGGTATIRNAKLVVYEL